MHVISIVGVVCILSSKPTYTHSILQGKAETFDVEDCSPSRRLLEAMPRRRGQQGLARGGRAIWGFCMRAAVPRIQALAARIP
jgi:hypothetical protein